MSEQMVSEFEAWFESLNHYTPEKQITPSGWYYWDQRVDDAWQAWKASRAALCVELPSMTNNGFDGFYPAYGVKMALKAAGVKTK